MGSAGQQLVVAPVPRERSGILWLDALLIVVASPVLALAAIAIAIAIYVDSPGPVLYRAQRVGRGGRPFQMLKFRKMRRDAHGHPLTTEDDERFTPIGRFLSATRLDELPQVVNVLRGQMRLVGPRPEVECFVAEFTDAYAEILTVTPGLTGSAQLEFVGERAVLAGGDAAMLYTDHLLPAKIEIDLAYVRNRSLAGDLTILIRTALLPARLAVTRLRPRASRWRAWMPWTASGVLLVTAFVLLSSHLS